MIAQRDVTCQAPGCERTHHLHIHHVKPWSQGGTTDPDNLILLCGNHHRGLHEGDFVIIALGKQRFRFQTKAGSELKPAPPMTKPPSWYPRRPSPRQCPYARRQRTDGPRLRNRGHLRSVGPP